MKKGFIFQIVLILVLIPFISVWSSEVAAAEASRIATLTKWQGSVYVNLAGGSQQLKAYKNMSLRQGDMITTGDDSSAILQFANGTDTDDSITIGANSTITISKLTNDKSTRTKMSLLTGTAWVDVKSIVNKDDEFRLETPTSIMEVRGTHFIINVDPRTGDTTLGVLAGIVQSVMQNDRSNQNTLNVYPGMQSYIPSDLTEMPPIAPIDFRSIVGSSSSQAIQQILNNIAQIQEENSQLIERIRQSGDIPLELGSLDGEALERFKHNVQHQMSFLLQNVVSHDVLSQAEVEELIRQANRNTNVTIDLNQKPQLSDREREQQERMQQLKQERQQQQEQKRAELERQQQEQNRILMERLQQERERQQKANEEAREQREQAARDQYRDRLAQEERDRFDQATRAREQERQEANPTPPPSSPAPSIPTESTPTPVEPEEPWEPPYPEEPSEPSEPSEPDWYIERPFDVVTDEVYGEPRGLNLNSDQIYYTNVDLEQSTIMIHQYGSDSPFKVISVKMLGEDYALNDGYFKVDLNVGTNELIVKVLDESTGYTHEYRLNIYCNELPYGALEWNLSYDSVRWFFKKSDESPDTKQYEVHILEGTGPVYFEFFMLEPFTLSAYIKDSEELLVLDFEYDGNDKYTFGPVEFGASGRIHRYLLEMEYQDVMRSYELIVIVEEASVE